MKKGLGICCPQLPHNYLQMNINLSQTLISYCALHKFHNQMPAVTKVVINLLQKNRDVIIVSARNALLRRKFNHLLRIPTAIEE